MFPPRQNSHLTKPTRYSLHRNRLRTQLEWITPPPSSQSGEMCFLLLLNGILRWPALFFFFLLFYFPFLVSSFLFRHGEEAQVSDRCCRPFLFVSAFYSSEPPKGTDRIATWCQLIDLFFPASGRIPEIVVALSLSFNHHITTSPATRGFLEKRQRERTREG